MDDMLEQTSPEESKQPVFWPAGVTTLAFFSGAGVFEAESAAGLLPVTACNEGMKLRSCPATSN